VTVRYLNAVVPRQRLLLLHAWATSDASGQVRAGSTWHEVLALLSWVDDGEVVQCPQIVVGGELVSLIDALTEQWPAMSETRLVVADWRPKHDGRSLQRFGPPLMERCVQRERERLGRLRQSRKPPGGPGGPNGHGKPPGMPEGGPEKRDDFPAS
jgi:hypothetical protein